MNCCWNVGRSVCNSFSLLSSGDQLSSCWLSTFFCLFQTNQEEHHFLCVRGFFSGKNNHPQAFSVSPGTDCSYADIDSFSLKFRCVCARVCARMSVCWSVGVGLQQLFSLQGVPWQCVFLCVCVCVCIWIFSIFLFFSPSVLKNNLSWSRLNSHVVLCKLQHKCIL